MTEVKPFYYYNEALLNMGAISSASEVQGFICGKLSGGKKAPETLPESWLAEIQRFMDMEYLELTEEQAKLVAELYFQSRNDLSDSNFGFRPLLPEDEASLQRRTDELAAWCRGFLHGLGSSGLQANDKLSAEVADALRDIAKISQAEIDEETGEGVSEEPGNEASNESLEADWESLVEYVKVAVLIINQEFGEPVQSVH